MKSKLTREHFLYAIEAQLKQTKPAPHHMAGLRGILVEMQAAGYTPDEVIRILEILRLKLKGSAEEELILDMLDIPTGFCAPHFRVW